MKNLLIMIVAMLCVTANSAIAQQGDYVTSADRTYGSDAEDTNNPEGLEPVEPLTPEEIEELKKNRYKIVKMTSDEDTITPTDNIAVDVFVLRTYVTAATSVRISDGITKLYDILAGNEALTLDDFLNGDDFKQLKNDLELQAENVVELGKLSLDAMKSVKADSSIPRRAKLLLAVNPMTKLSKMIISESKTQV